MQIHCPRCKGRREVEAERVQWEKPRRVVYGFKGLCPDCGGVCVRFNGNSAWEGGETPPRERGIAHRRRKKQREFYDVVENLPPIKACYSKEE